ncbi:MAG TPA: DegT/DnrJ/EryC1/StrS family aminotransferase, partial [Nitrospira sp.]|nr:DegT/DnrJ/EryC1/StrS family aminotransferase [Nitrospira sp.]
TQQRIASWQFYHQLLQPMEQRGMIRRPVIPEKCEHNAHMYYVLLPSASDREAALTAFKEENIGAVFHYVPLHSAPAGQRYGRAAGPLSITESTSKRLIRLPLFIGLTGEQQEQIVTLLNRTLHKQVHLSTS